MEMKIRVLAAVTYLHTNTRMTCFIKGWMTSVGNPVEHQTPLVRGRRRIPEEVVQQDLGFVGHQVNAKKSETDIVEFKALALIQRPTRMNQVNRQCGNVVTDMIRFFPTLFRNFSFAASLRTSMPGWEGLVRNRFHKQSIIHWSAPN